MPLPPRDRSLDASAGLLLRQGLDLVMDWADGASCRLQAWRDGREGVQGELTVSFQGHRYSWGRWSLSSTTARDSLAKRLLAQLPQIAWGAHLEDAAYRFTDAARLGDPWVTLTGQTGDGPAAVVPGWLYEGEPTLLYADGNTGKSLTAMLLTVIVMTGTGVPGVFEPVQPRSAAYLDWETTAVTADARLGQVAGHLGVTAPPVLYKRMTRPLVDDLGRVAQELASRHVGLVVVDSQMFAVSMGDGAAFHEPITAFYSALRVLAPAAILVVNHITNADARTGTPTRPFGGAFAFNSPRLIWEARRDWTQEEILTVAFTCTKANNVKKPVPFGLQFGPRGITTYTPVEGERNSVTLEAGLKQAVKYALSVTPKTVAELAQELGVDPVAIRVTLNRHKWRENHGEFVVVPGPKPLRWALVSARPPAAPRNSP